MGLLYLWLQYKEKVLRDTGLKLTRNYQSFKWLVFFNVGYVYEGNRAVGLGIIS